MQFYLKLHAGEFRGSFRSETTPTRASHGHLAPFIVGPLHTRRAVRILKLAGYGGMTVQEANYLARHPEEL